MHKKLINNNKILILAILVFMSFFGMNNVLAKSTATCVYYPFEGDKAKTQKLIYEYEDGKISFTREFNEYNPIKVTSNVLPSQFISENKVICPDLYVAYGETKEIVVFSSPINQSKVYYQILPDDSLSSVINDDIKIYTSTITIPYVNLSNSSEDVTIISKDGKTISAYAKNPDISVDLNEVSFSDVFKADGEALKSFNFNAFCYSYSSSSYCSISKTASNISGESKPVYSEKLNMTADQVKDETKTLNIEFDSGMPTCGSMSVILDFANDIYGLIIVLVVVGLIVLTMLDFMKATSSGKDDANQKAFKAFKTRLVVGVIIILLPTLLRFTFDLFGMATEEEYVTCIPRS